MCSVLFAPCIADNRTRVTERTQSAGADRADSLPDQRTAPVLLAPCIADNRTRVTERSCVVSGHALENDRSDLSARAVRFGRGVVSASASHRIAAQRIAAQRRTAPRK